MLGAIGNRGVDPAHAGAIIKTYVNDPNANVRASAIEGLSILATDDTVPLLLDRFRSDPSPMVQERAACDLAESGMYTHAQRMVAAATLVTWLDDSSLSAAQREWTLHALRDISGQNLGTDSSAWRHWYESSQ
jgi:HEAT repeat protein